MTILEDEIRRRYEERRKAKSSLWSNWLLKVILILAIAIVVRFTGQFIELSDKEARENEIETERVETQ